MIAFYLILFIAGFISYYNRKYVIFLLSVLGLMTKLFMLDTSVSSGLNIKGDDLSLVLFIILLPFVYSRNKNVFSIHHDPLTRWVYIFMALYWVELLITVAFGREGLFNSLKVIRVSFVMWSFFVFKTIPIEDYKQFIKVALWITLIQSVLYLLQFAGIRILAGGGDKELFLGEARYTAINTPTLTTLFIFLLWKMDYLKKYRFYLFVFLLGLVFLRFVRGSVISVLIGIAYYAFVKSEKKRRIPVILAFLVIIPVASWVIDSKSEASSQSGGFEDIMNVIKNRSDFTMIDKANGTFSYRIAMLTERVVWLTEHPEYLVTGVGTMHEDSPKTLQMFNFSIGTHNEERALGYTIIESGDITWVPIVLRYGLVGVIIHVMMFVVLFQVTRKRKDLLIMIAAYSICLFAGSFDGAYFEMPLRVYLLALFFAIVSRANVYKKQMIM